MSPNRTTNVKAPSSGSRSEVPAPSTKGAEAAAIPAAIPAGQGSDRFVQAFAKGLGVICAFDPQAPMTITELAKAAGLDRAGTRRILLTLVTLGYVRSDGKRFWLTPRVLNLGYRYLASLPFWHIAQPVMEELVTEVQETCSIGVLDGDNVVFILRVPTRRFLSFDPSIGSQVPAYLHSMGRVLLSRLPAAELRDYLARVRLEPLTRQTIASKAELERALLEDAEKGWSFVSEQYEEGMCGIAVPILGAHGSPVAALNVSLNAGPQAQELAVTHILPKLRLAARRLSSVPR
ncbi:MAG: helix-turn-helix domain-containing protein [Proteobacteria bacterium]|nr:helix-turn-helix domain-containing protein [Pseudomonadota bacterium]